MIVFCNVYHNVSVVLIVSTFTFYQAVTKTIEGPFTLGQGVAVCALHTLYR